MPKTLDELLAETEAERLAGIERDEARRASPEAQADLAAKKAREHALGVREGWWDEDGNPLAAEPDDEEGDEEE